MKSFAFDKLAAKEVTMKSLVLNPFLVTVRTEDGKTNITTISYVGVASEMPPIITLAIRPKRYCHELISQKKYFCLNLPSLDLLRTVDYCGTFSGRKRDKFKDSKVTLNRAKTIDSSFIENAPLVLECKLQTVMELSKNRDATHDLFLARVVHAFSHKNFSIEKHNAVVTTNYDYRIVGDSVAKAHQFWQTNKKGR